MNSPANCDQVLHDTAAGTADGIRDSFADLQNDILRCVKCSLASSRRQVICGEGNPRAPIMVIGEAPGRDEDIQGRPFVGKSGQLLDKIFAACGFTRQKHLFISNIVKCRPPNNRVPTPEEAHACLPWLWQQIDIIDPSILILLGATALKHLAGPDHRITREHGQWLSIHNRRAMPVFHPSALLRNPALKRDTWEDYKNIVRKYREVVTEDHYCPHL